MRSKDKSLDALEKQIVDLYEKGYSQKDIRASLHVSLPFVRTILIERQYPTTRYRAVSSETKDIIELLVYEQYSYRVISLILNISFHVIRELPNTRDLRISNRERFPLNEETNHSVYELFLSEYKKGCSFLELYSRLSLGLQDVCPLAKKILEDSSILPMHQECLIKRIHLLLAEEHPVHMIAKQLHISVSVVKEQKKLLQKAE